MNKLARFVLFDFYTNYIYNNISMKSNLTNKDVYDFYRSSIDDIRRIRKLVEELDSNYINVLHVVNKRVNDNIKSHMTDLSIVMTTKNRQKQTYFTLKTISDNLSFLNATINRAKNIQIIIVDDSNDKNRLDIEHLQLIVDRCDNINIVYITVRNKFWVNPCVSYNIGFKFITSKLTIIQNSEVCHMGNVIKIVFDHYTKDDNEINTNDYLIFDVMATRSMNDNEILYKKDIQTYMKEVFSNIKKCSWYQHKTLRNGNLHFLTCIGTKYLSMIGGGFDLDYSMATCFDDNAFIDQLKHIGLKFVNIECEKYKVFGIHQWHTSENPGMTLSNVHNQHLLYAKQKIIKDTGEYVYLNNDNLKSMFDIRS